MQHDVPELSFAEFTATPNKNATCGGAFTGCLCSAACGCCPPSEEQRVGARWDREIPHQGEEKRGAGKEEVIANSGSDCHYPNPQLSYNLSSYLKNFLKY